MKLSSTAPPCQVPQGRNNQEPGTGVPGTDTSQDESRRDGTVQSGIPASLNDPGHKRVNLEICAVPIGTRSLCQAYPALPCRALHCSVPSGLGAVVRCGLDQPGGRCFCADSRGTRSFLSYDTDSEGTCLGPLRTRGAHPVQKYHTSGVTFGLSAQL
jgi:hypothetical protein